LIVDEPKGLGKARTSVWANRIVESIRSYEGLQDGVQHLRDHLSSGSWKQNVELLLQQMQAVLSARRL
jgi:hypothetical protein